MAYSSLESSGNKLGSLLGCGSWQWACQRWGGGDSKYVEEVSSSRTSGSPAHVRSWVSWPLYLEVKAGRRDSQNQRCPVRGSELLISAWDFGTGDQSPGRGLVIGNLGPGIGRCGIHKKSLRKEFGNNRKGRSPANRAQAQSRPGRAAGEKRGTVVPRQEAAPSVRNRTLTQTGHQSGPKARRMPTTATNLFSL